MNLRQRIWTVLEIAEAQDRTSRLFDSFIIGLILLNVFAVIVASVPAIEQQYRTIFFGVANLFADGW